MLDLNEDTQQKVQESASFALACFKKRPNTPELKAGELFHIVTEPKIQYNMISQGVLNLPESRVSIVALGDMGGYAIFLHKTQHDKETNDILMQMFETDVEIEEPLLGSLPRGIVYVMQIQQDSNTFCHANYQLGHASVYIA